MNYIYRRSGILESASVTRVELHAALEAVALALAHGAVHVTLHTDCRSLEAIVQGQGRRAQRDPAIAELVAWYLCRCSGL